MSNLAEKIRAARNISIKVGNITFTGTRCTAEDVLDSQKTGGSLSDLCRNHITGWHGVTEADVIEGGSKDLVEFDKEAFDLLIGDRSDWFQEIGPALYKDTVAHHEARNKKEKK